MRIWENPEREMTKLPHIRGFDKYHARIRLTDLAEIKRRSAGACLEIAVKQYEVGLISLGKAAEIANLPYDKMMRKLESRGVPLRLGPPSLDEAKKREERLVASLKKLRRGS